MYKLDKQEREYRDKMRGRYPKEPRWYAVMTHHGRERRAWELLEEALDGAAVVEEFFLPEASTNGKRRGEQPPQLLFNSYLFMRCLLNDAIYEAVSECPEAFQILGRAHRIPSALDDKEIDNLKSILASGGRPHLVNRVGTGDRIEVVKGLMKGVTGCVLERNNKNVKIEVPFSFLDMGTMVAVSIPLEYVRICESA